MAPPHIATDGVHGLHRTMHTSVAVPHAAATTWLRTHRRRRLRCTWTHSRQNRPQQRATAIAWALSRAQTAALQSMCVLRWNCTYDEKLLDSNLHRNASLVAAASSVSRSCASCSHLQCVHAHQHSVGVHACTPFAGADTGGWGSGEHSSSFRCSRCRARQQRRQSFCRGSGCGGGEGVPAVAQLAAPRRAL